MAVADVRFFKAAIAGFAPTTLNPTAAGWTQITGTADLGQSATHLVIIDNGLIRVIVDKNVTGNNNDAFSVYAYAAGAWQNVMDSIGTFLGSYTITAVAKNSPELFECSLSWLNIGSGTKTYTGKLRVSAVIPAFGLRIETKDGTDDGEFDFALANIAVRKTYLGGNSGTIYASDIYGDQSDDSATPTPDGMFVAPLPGLGLDTIWAVNTDESFFHDRDTAALTREGYHNFSSADAPAWLFFGFMPRTYGMGDGGGANVGNGDGQLREAEDNHSQGGGGTFTSDNDANGSAGKILRNTAPANGHFASWSMNFPAAGMYYILAPQGMTGANSTTRLSVPGATGTTSYDKEVGSSGFGVVGAHILYGPFTIPSSGNFTVSLTMITLGAATAWYIDHISIFPYEATASSPTTAIFPKDLARALLRQVTPA